MPRLPFHHIGYVVDDLEAAGADAVARFGAGPFYLAEHMEFDEVTFHGEPALFGHSSAVDQWGAVRVALTGQTMAPAGPGRVGHVGILIDSLEEARARLEPTCGPPHHTGRTVPVSAVELLQRNDFLLAAYAQAAEGSDGSDPLRPMRDVAQAG